MTDLATLLDELEDEAGVTKYDPSPTPSPSLVVDSDGVLEMSRKVSEPAPAHSFSLDSLVGSLDGLVASETAADHDSIRSSDIGLSANLKNIMGQLRSQGGSYEQLLNKNADKPGAMVGEKGILKRDVESSTCIVCRDILNTGGGGKWLEVPGKLGAMSHERCWKCVQCACPLLEEEFFDVNDNPYCRLCHESFLLSRCTKCAKPVRGNKLDVDGQIFHPSCFVCTRCGDSLTDSFFNGEDNKPFCKTCITL